MSACLYQRYKALPMIFAVDTGEGCISLRVQIVTHRHRCSPAPFCQIGVRIPGAYAHRTHVDGLSKSKRKFTFCGLASLFDGHLSRNVPPINDNEIGHALYPPTRTVLPENQGLSLLSHDVRALKCDVHHCCFCDRDFSGISVFNPGPP
eukprot:gene9806-12039_t